MTENVRVRNADSAFFIKTDLFLLEEFSESQIIRKMCYPLNAFKIILKISSQICHVIHFHDNIKIVRMSNPIECCNQGLSTKTAGNAPPSSVILRQPSWTHALIRLSGFVFI